MRRLSGLPAIGAPAMWPLVELWKSTPPHLDAVVFPPGAPWYLAVGRNLQAVLPVLPQRFEAVCCSVSALLHVRTGVNAVGGLSGPAAPVGPIAPQGCRKSLARMSD